MTLCACTGPYPDVPSFCKALLAVEGCTVAFEGAHSMSETAGVDHAREAAKSLLTKQRHNLALWAAYAQLEFQAGQHKVRLLHYMLHLKLSVILSLCKSKVGAMICCLITSCKAATQCVLLVCHEVCAMDLMQLSQRKTCISGCCHELSAGRQARQFARNRTRFLSSRMSAATKCVRVQS